MIGLDTNVLLRITLRDDESQFKRAISFLEHATAESPSFVNLIVLVEFVWTLRRLYRYPLSETLSAVERLIGSPAVRFEREHLVLKAMQTCRVDGIDLSDALIAAINREEGCTNTITFDGCFVRSGEAMAIP